MKTQELFDRVIAQHKTYYAEKPDGEIRPMVIFETAKGDIEVAPLSFADEDEKHLLCLSLRAIFSKLGVVRYVFFSESWAASYKDMGALRNGSMPSQRQDRVEIIMTVAADRDGAKLGSTLEMVRDWTTGHVTELKDWDLKGDGFGGRFAELLDDE